MDPKRPGAVPTLIDRHERLYAPFKIQVLLRTLGELGVGAAPLLAGCGLSAEEATSPHTKVSVQQFLTACANAARLSPTPDWAVLAGSRMRVTDYGLYGYALLSSETFLAACKIAVRFHALATPVLPIRAPVPRPPHVAWRYPEPEEAGLADLDRALFEALLQMQVVLHVTLTRDLMGPACTPVSVSLATAAPRHAGSIERHVGLPVQFGAESTEIVYPQHWLERRLPMGNAITATQVSATCARLLEEHRWSSGLTRQVYNALMCTPGRFPRIDEIADTLHLSGRTVRRKLDEEGTSYSLLLTSVRKALAMDYLSTSLLPVDDIAAALGFSEAASFRHAFKKWTGQTPAQFRDRPRHCPGIQSSRPEVHGMQVPR